MALLERYLDAVGRHLPPAEEEDILAELRDDIQAKYDRRAEELGRALTQDDEAELLRPYGRPIVLASRYRKPQHLVGPAWFPFYWNTLKIALAVALIVAVGLPLVLALMGRSPGAIVRALFNFPETALTVFAWVTIVFAAVEAFTSSTKFRDNWDPRSLPRPRPAGVARTSRFDVAIELGVSAAFLGWWTAAHRSPDLLFLPPVVALGPWWASVYLPLAALLLVSIVVKAVILVRPDWTGFRLAAGLLTTAAGTAIALFVAWSEPLLTGSGAGGEKLAGILESLLRWSIGVAVVIAVTTTALEAWRYLRARRRTGQVSTT
ncbi:MAG TPA: hypothetical protein PKK95_11900 [Vicinamibacterales bacterium]|nr:hypothetical protein [Acidobacteriota bacterium]HOC18968.1 hypothetical protein [Vicinamibacterales bacterium]